MKNLPVEVSVIIPVKNGVAYIGRCLRSLISQNFEREKFEIILVNDNSTDKTREAIEPYLGDIVYLENKKSLGLPGSLNKGIKHAKGQYIVRVDSDDWVHKEYINILYNIIHLSNDLDAVACDYYLMNDQEKIISRKNCLKNPIGCGIIFKSHHLIDLGLYDKNLMSSGDEDLLIRFKKKYKLFRIPSPLYRYRRHQNNMTNNKKLLKKYDKKLKKKHGKK